MASPTRDRAVLLATGAASALGGALACLLVRRRLQWEARGRAQAAETGEETMCTPCEDAPVVEERQLAGAGVIAARPTKDPFAPGKRQGAMSWDDYFMALAFLSAQRSKDPNKQVGACIVSENNVILSIGYNGFPRGISDDDLPWAKQSRTGDPLETKYPYVCHAEANAILNTNTDRMGGQRLYVTMFPCNECAKMIVQAGLREVVYCEAKDATRRADWACYEASKRLLRLAGVRTRQHRLRAQVVVWPGESPPAAADEAAGASEAHAAS